MKKNITIKDLPSPKGSLILGNLKEFKENEVHLILEKWIKDVGPVLKVNLAGKKIFVSGDAELNSAILKSRPNKFRRLSNMDEIMSEAGVVSVLNTEGDQWRDHRKYTSGALSLKNVKNFFPQFKMITERLLRHCEGFDGEVMDFQKEIMRYTVDLTTLFSFGYDINTMEKEEDIFHGHIKSVFSMIVKRIISPVPVWRWLKSKQDKAFDASLLEVNNIVQRFINEAKIKISQSTELERLPENFLEALLVEQKKGARLTDKEVFGNVFSMLLAGEDTTANTISWIIYYLSQNKNIVETLRMEVDAVLENDALPSSNAQLSALKYTEAVAMEAMRLKPVAPNIYLEAVENVVVQGYEIKKGMHMIIQIKVAQNDAKNFSEPDRFIPERWIVNACPHLEKHNGAMFNTFGSGPRFCPGRNFAFYEIKMVIAMIVKNFDIVLAVNAVDVKEIFSFSMHPDNLKVKLNARR